jgi:undecaprenyl-diphosphatase
MTFVQALILGIVEGITEFLPISSTAHLEIASWVLNISQTDFVKTFEIVIQSGAILAVVVLYFRMLIRNFDIWKKIIVAFIPTGIIGLLLHPIIKHYLVGNFTLLMWTLGLGGVALILFERWYIKREERYGIYNLNSISYRTAFIIGCVQALAIVPGVSRAAATIVAGLALRIKRAAVVEFSFLLAIPTIIAAAGYDLMKTSPTVITGNVLYLGVGFIAAFVSALIAISFLLKYIQRKDFILFGVYRIGIALILIILLYAA